MSGRAIREEGADRLRSPWFKKVIRPWWPAGRAAASARLRSPIRPLLDQKLKNKLPDANWSEKALNTVKKRFRHY